MARVSIVIPTYNERDNIAPLLEALFSMEALSGNELSVFVADDQSPDGTGEIVSRLMAKEPRIELLSAPRRGYGAAMVRALAKAKARADFVVSMDADFSHSPQDIPRLLAALTQGADLAIGSRYIGGNRTPSEWGWRRRALSWGGNTLARYWMALYPLHDCTAGFRAWRTDVLQCIDLKGIPVSGYAFVVASLRLAVARNARIVEIPVEFPDRTRGASKLGLRDIAEFAFWALRHPGAARNHE